MLPRLEAWATSGNETPSKFGGHPVCNRSDAHPPDLGGATKTMFKRMTRVTHSITGPGNYDTNAEDCFARV